MIEVVDTLNDKQKERMMDSAPFTESHRALIKEFSDTFVAELVEQTLTHDLSKLEEDVLRCNDCCF